MIIPYEQGKSMLKKTFNNKDQINFASLTGDFNPMHVDEKQARRMIFGGQIVHGVHLVFCALDDLAKNKRRGLNIQKLSVRFLKPVSINEELYIVGDIKNDKAEYKILKGDMLCTIINLEIGAREIDNMLTSELLHFDKWETTPKKIQASEILKSKGQLRKLINVAKLHELFSTLYEGYDLNQIAFIASTTRLVGMLCPGNNSVYSSLDIDFNCDEVVSSYDFTVNKFDKRFKVIEIMLGAELARIKAFYRPDTVSQQPYDAIKKHIKTDNFKNMTALVVGGSRGIGEVTVKLLSAGDANVYYTYYKGSEEAEKVYSDIAKDNEKINKPIQLDILNITEQELNELLVGKGITHLLYFATPGIKPVDDKYFNFDLFISFSKYYLEGVTKIVKCLGSTLTHVFIPSSDFIDSMPVNMAEYTAAKAAAEILYANIAKKKNINIVFPRLPKTTTDQTSGILPSGSKDPVPQMIDYLNNM